MTTHMKNMEEALLGYNSIIENELENVVHQFPKICALNDPSQTEYCVPTDKGSVLVAIQGVRSNPALITYHDLGFNYLTSFQSFFNYPEMRMIQKHFCIYHINAPGQEEGAATLPADFIYPTMDELAYQINYVLGFFGIKEFIGFGVGLGANVLARFAISFPEKVSCLCLINCSPSQTGWLEWSNRKMNRLNVHLKGEAASMVDYLMSYHFGWTSQERNLDLMQMYRSYFSQNNPHNVSLLIDSYMSRSDLGISRKGSTIKVPVMNITGANSPRVDDTVNFNARLDPTKSTWMKFSDCVLLLEEQPGKVAEAFKLFLQGEGYVSSPLPVKGLVQLRVRRIHRRRKPLCRLSSVIRIIENPISEVMAY